MLFTITTTHKPATDLGYLLYKNPAAVQSFDLTFGKAHVFYSEASDDRCTACLLLDVDPVGLVRGKPDSAGGQFEQYVNDRPYVASSFLSVALAQVFGTALSGKSKQRPELAILPIPLEATISAVPCRGGESILRRLFEPLGYTVEVTRQPLDEVFPEWGESNCYSLRLTGLVTVHDLLSHMYVLIPVLDNAKHYYFQEEEVEKLLRHGEGWLAAHPERNYIAARYLRHRSKLTRLALDRLSEGDDLDPDASVEAHANEEAQIEDRISLNERRMLAVLSALENSGARSVVDLGCGEGRLVGRMLANNQFTAVVGVDVSHRALEVAASRLKLERMSERQRQRIKLMQGSLTYKDKRLSGFDAATCIEVIVHLDPPRLSSLERVIFEFAKPQTVVITTPNIEYNARFENLPNGQLRHRDHRFEWTRAQFQSWANEVCQRYGYQVSFSGIGDEDAELGSPTQMGVFSI